eukprot:jgi/Mesvir1/10629/Mv16755-RA.1
MNRLSLAIIASSGLKRYLCPVLDASSRWAGVQWQASAQETGLCRKFSSAVRVIGTQKTTPIPAAANKIDDDTDTVNDGKPGLTNHLRELVAPAGRENLGVSQGDPSAIGVDRGVGPHSSAANIAQVHVPIKAHFIAPEIDVGRVVRDLFPPSQFSIAVGKDATIVSPRNSDNETDENRQSLPKGVAESRQKLLVLFSFGGVVGFNFHDPQELLAHVDRITAATCPTAAAGNGSKGARGLWSNLMARFGWGPSKLWSEGVMAALPGGQGQGAERTLEDRALPTEDYALVVRPSLREWSSGRVDPIVVQMLDNDNVRVISSVLAQTVALDFYSRRVDRLMQKFIGINEELGRTGLFHISKKELFKLVAFQNNLITNILTKLRLLERSETAWKCQQYYDIWQSLRQDLDIEERWEHLNFKVDMLQRQMTFFLEILQNRKSDFLEWTIIILIAIEIVVSLYDITTSRSISLF